MAASAQRRMVVVETEQVAIEPHVEPEMSAANDEATVAIAKLQAAAENESVGDRQDEPETADAHEAETAARDEPETAVDAQAETPAQAEPETTVGDNEPETATEAGQGAVQAETAQDEPDATVEARPEEMRLIEAVLFAAAEPVSEKELAQRLPDNVDVGATLRRLQTDYAARGVNLVSVAGRWTFRTANDLSWLLSKESVEPKKLSRAGIETLAIIAYHQPVTRAEIEEIRGVSTSKGTLDVLLETGWIRPRGRRKTPGRPLTFGTTPEFLSHFGLEAVSDLPGLDELKGTGLLDGRLPPGFGVPSPSDDTTLRDDEDPLEPGDLDLTLAPSPSGEGE